MDTNESPRCDWLTLRGIPCPHSGAQGFGKISGGAGQEVWLCQGHYEYEMQTQRSLTPDAPNLKALVDAMWQRLVAERVF